MDIKTCFLFALLTICILMHDAAAERPKRCNQTKESGACYAAFTRYAYMPNGKCEEFIYGGCDGNENNFETKEACEQTCVNVE